MKLLPIAAAWLLALQGQAEAAQPTVAPPVVPPMPYPPPPTGPMPYLPPPPPSEALIERFLASLPKEARVGSSVVKLGPESVKRLIGLNPGKEAQIATILSRFEKCFEPAVGEGMERVNRMVAQSPFLGAEKLERLTAFFGRGGWAMLSAIADRTAKSATPAAADVAEMNRLMTAYPLVEFSMSLQIAALNATHQGAFAAAKKCEDERNAALLAAGIENSLKSLFRP